MSGCPRRAARRGLCDTHAQEVEARYRANHPDTRPSASARGYDSHWRMTRKAFLRKHPTCSEPGCKQTATHVDHMQAKAQGGTDAWTNLQGLCASHHSVKTNQQDGGFGNPVRGAVTGRPGREREL